MRNKFLIYLDRDRNPAKQKEFAKVAEKYANKYGVIAHPAHNGQQILDLAEKCQTKIDNFIIISHGFTNRLISSRGGVHAKIHALPTWTSLEAFSAAWAPFMDESVKITLAACLCSRSPTRTIRKRLGRAFGTWEPLVHKNGGADSFSGLLRDELVSLGLKPTIRGHTTPGHVLDNPACRQHDPHLGEVGRSLFDMALYPLGIKPTWRTCRQFNNIVKGHLAARWLLFEDEGVLDDIRSSWRNVIR